MKNIMTKIWRKDTKKAVTIAIIACLALAGIFSFNAYADTNIFNIKNATISNKSETTDAEIVSFDGLDIVSNLTFHKLGDTATYTISLENTDDTDH